jgi:hypothetical protein
MEYKMDESSYTIKITNIIPIDVSDENNLLEDVKRSRNIIGETEFISEWDHDSFFTGGLSKCL